MPLTVEQYNANRVTVQAGQTLEQIAKQVGVSVSDLLKANPDLDANNLKVGQGINVQHPFILEAKNAVAKAIDMGYGEDYEFLIAENADILIKPQKNTTYGAIREDLGTEPEELSRKNKLYEKYPDADSYDNIKIKKGDVIIVPRDLDPHPYKNPIARAFYNAWKKL